MYEFDFEDDKDFEIIYHDIKIISLEFLEFLIGINPNIMDRFRLDSDCFTEKGIEVYESYSNYIGNGGYSRNSEKPKIPFKCVAIGYQKESY